MPPHTSLRGANSEAFRLLVENVRVVIWEADPATFNFTYVSDFCEELLGYPPSAWLEPGFWAAHIHPVDAAGAVAYCLQCTTAARDHRFEYRMVRADGAEVWIDDSVKVVAEGGRVTALRGALVDITERKRNEQAIRDSETRYRAFVDHATDAMFLHVPQGRILDVNRQACESLGYSRDELIGQTPVFFDPETTAREIAQHGQCLDAGETIAFDSRHQRKDGTNFPVAVRIRPFTVNGQRFALALARDITDRKAIEAELRANSEALLRQNRVMERMAAGDPLPEVLDQIVDLIEVQLPGTICSILLLDRGKGRLRFSSGRNLPLSYSQAIDGVRIGPAVGSFGTAAFRGEAVVVADIATDPLWRNYSDLAVMHGLRSCWSVPIFGGGVSTGQGATSDVLGTFAVYKHEPASPEPGALEVIVRAAHLAGIAIERDAAAVALRESEQRFRDLVELAPDGFAIIQQGRFAYANQAAARLAGVKSPAALTGVLLADFMHPDDVSTSMLRQEAVLASDQPVPLRQFRVRRGDGTWMVMESCAGPCRHNGQPAIQLIARDVSERTRTEIALRESEERFRQIAAAIEHVFWMISYPEIRVLYVSTAFERIWGRKAAELYANPACWFEGIAPQDRPQVQEHYSRWLLDPASESFEIEYRVVRPDGEIRWVLDRGTAIRDEHGSVYRLTGLAQDITEKKHLESQFRQAQKMEAVGQLAGGIAHDFNNLLMVVSGFSELLMEDSACTDSQREAVSAIRAAAARAAGLTRQLLAFSRKQLLEPVTLDLNELVRQAESMIRRVIREDVAVTVRLAPDLLRIKADPAQIEQVLLNLVLNARDAMPAGGCLSIETDNVEQPPGMQFVRLRVSDTGAGMTEAAKSKIFEPFFTTKPIGQGTGLGMAVVHGIVSQSGGQIRVDSEMGVGTTVVLLLPVTHAPLFAQKSPARSISNVRGAETILLAEDEPAVRRVVRSSLEQQGYTVLESEHGASALEVASRHAGAIHLLLTDMVMPLMGGRQLAEIVAAQRPGLRVLYMSGYTDDASLQHGLENSPIRLLQKPFDPDALVKKVREVLDESPSTNL